MIKDIFLTLMKIFHILYLYRMIYEQNCYNLNVKYFDNLIEINIKNIPNKFIRFKIYENI